MRACKLYDSECQLSFKHPRHVSLHCVQNYNRAPMMALAVPVAVRFLQQGNRELSRNMSSYLSLAAITKAELLVRHTLAIISSVLGGMGSGQRSKGHIRPPTEHLHTQVGENNSGYKRRVIFFCPLYIYRVGI